MKSQEFSKQPISLANSEQHCKNSTSSEKQGTFRAISKLPKQGSYKTPQNAHENSRDFKDSKKRINPDSPVLNGPNKRQKILHRDNSDECQSQKASIDMETLKKNFVPIGDFKQVVDELAEIKVNFNEVSKKLDAIMKI